MSGIWFAFTTLALAAVVAWYIKHDKAPPDKRPKKFGRSGPSPS
jgi:hypothetical protein